MKKVFKYTLKNTLEPQGVLIPAGAKPLRFDMQKEDPTLWVEVDPERVPAAYNFQIFGTGHPIPDKAEYMGTCFDGDFVWHLYALV